MAKVALVTGANKGIGFETARLLGKKGYTVWLGARDEARGKKAAETLKKENFDVRFISLDVTNEASVKAAAERVEAETGALDVLINNAGIYLADKDGEASVTSLETVREVYEVNVFGAMRVTQKFVPLLKKAKHSSIVMVSSGLGSVTWQADLTSGMSTVKAISYNSSKSALNGIAIGFANELRESGIKVNCVNPGYNATDLNDHAGTHPPTHGAALVVQAAFLGEAGPTGVFVDEKGTCPW
ncbi:MAG: SDR family oxidoreductase [Proteobacteria bacterium]|nr:MAG: SDR family oxidoreductase [Pseudomonadota bacterium]